MKSFSGFAAGKTSSVLLPEAVFDELIPLIDDLDELKVTLHVLRLLAKQHSNTKHVRLEVLLEDQALLDSLEQPTGAALEQALARAVERGTLLRVQTDPGDSLETVFFANSPRGRAALEAVRRGESLSEADTFARPNVFLLYEENIGPLTPLLAEELQEAEGLYPPEWIEEAFREAVSLNKRNWKYIRAILRRWHSEGRSDEASRRDREGGRGYIEGKYGEFIDR